MGSGMPLALWRRAKARFAPAGILEFYASTEGEAVLANIDGESVGAKGTRLPGSASLKLAAYDSSTKRLTEGDDGYAVEVADGETGMLLVRAPDDGSRNGVLRGLFAPDDAWLQTGDLFRRLNGEYWLAGTVTQLINTRQGPVAALPVEDAIGRIDGIDLVLGYGYKQGNDEVLVAAITTVEDYLPTAVELTSALADLPVKERPARIHCVAEIESTSWYRLQVTAGWKSKTPKATAARPVFELDSNGQYRKSPSKAE